MGKSIRDHSSGSELQRNVVFDISRGQSYAFGDFKSTSITEDDQISSVSSVCKCHSSPSAKVQQLLETKCNCVLS
jgi:hypothetical protein